MNPESQAFEQNISPKEAYFQIIKKRVQELQEMGELTDAFAERTLTGYALVEGPFKNNSDAEKKGLSSLEMSVEPMAVYIRQLNNAEIKLLSFSGDVIVALESLEKTDLSKEEKLRVSKDVREIGVEIENFTEKIRTARSLIA